MVSQCSNRRCDFKSSKVIGDEKLYYSIILEIRYPLLLVYLAVWIMLIIGNAGTVDNITDLIGELKYRRCKTTLIFWRSVNGY